jgi:hypothetical protein
MRAGKEPVGSRVRPLEAAAGGGLSYDDCTHVYQWSKRESCMNIAQTIPLSEAIAQLQTAETVYV